MKRAWERPDDLRPNRVDILRIQTRQLRPGQVRAFVYLFEQRGEYSKGHRDFGSDLEVMRWLDEMDEELTARGWTKRRCGRRRNNR